jgi:ABC-type transport system involved in multi-copper enzyme maturation permease subunit
MTPSLVWKEYREQRSFWVALALVSVLALVGSTWLLSLQGLSVDRDLTAGLQSLAVLLAWTHGLVCGALLLANEREGGTLSFLDQLPLTRWQLWRAKCLSGAGLTLGQIAVLLVSVRIVQGSREGDSWSLVLVELLVSGLFGLAWGMLFSSFTRNVLNGIGLALLTGIFAYPVVAIPVASVIALAPEQKNGIVEALVALVAGAMSVAPLIGSALIFTRPDRLRRGSRVRRFEGRAVGAAGPGRGWRVLFWLTWRQMRRFALILLPIGFLLGLALPAFGYSLWPTATLIVGVLCGVTAFQDEQEHGANRFLGEQRFPLGRVWAVKVGLRFALALAVAVLMLLPTSVIALLRPLLFPTGTNRETTLFQEIFRVRGLEEAIQPRVFLPLWLLYGFSVGQLCGLVFRRGLVAVVVSLILMVGV